MTCASRRRGSLAVVVAIALLTTLLWVPHGSRALAPSAIGEFHPVTVTRIFDSREFATWPAATAAGTSFDVNLTGGVLPDDPSRITGVVANVTVTGSTVDGYLTTGPSGRSRPSTSTVNFTRGSTAPNLALLRPGSDGRVTFTLVAYGSVSGRAAVIVDVFGYLSSAAGDRGSRFTATPSTRLLDTRRTSSPLGRGGVADLPIRGADGFSPTMPDAVPDDAGVDAVALTVTVDNARRDSADTWVSVVSGGSAVPPSTSNLNVDAGATRANLVIVPVGPDGSVRIYNAFGSTDVIVDLVGYFRPVADGRSLAGRIVPMDQPVRVVDSRPVPLAAGQTDVWDLAPFLNTVSASGRSVGATAGLFANLTATTLTRTASGVPVTSYLTVFPADSDRPGTSNVNVPEGTDVATAAVLPVSASRSMAVYNAFGSLDYVIDVFGIILAD